ncbi:MAG: prepilin-type N-terminal cleavage/methylation domain-containing protein [Candidatus Terrybacteria bacterium]|nr:prepilin-type N-terminal cleavage/methylation domain-containing protein [Candidatus Terrybacteria bacterium]
MGFWHWVFRAQRGFTLIEVVLSVAIIMLVGAALLVSFAQLERSTALNRSSDGVSVFLRLARERTIAAENNAQWGVNVAVDQMRLFTGASFSGDAEDTFTLPNGVTATAALAGGGSDVVFDRIDGTTATSGTITLTGPGGGQRILTVFSSGDAVASSTLPPPLDTRVTDTRHAHLALPFSLNGSTTMTLTFSDPPNPDTVQAINIPSQISGGQFFWEGSVDVNGSAQQLVLVTHAIGVSTTDLSVARDRTQNDKALVIDVDGTVIASYTATGTLTGGVGVTVSIQ